MTLSFAVSAQYCTLIAPGVGHFPRM